MLQHNIKANMKLDLVQFVSNIQEKLSNEHCPFQGEQPVESTQTLSKEKEEVGEVIYEKLIGEYPNEAAKLTGMLLQMDYKDLVRVIAEPDLFRKKVKLAFSVLQSGSYVKPPPPPV